MPDEAPQPADDEQARPGPLGYFNRVPNELLASIVRFCVASGRECDASALARTNKELYKPVNDELYHLVIKHKTFHLVYWAAMGNQTGTLKIAFENGADPNQMWTSATVERPPLKDRDYFRPLGWGLETTEKLDRAVWLQHLTVDPWIFDRGFAHANIGQVSPHTCWFSSTRLLAMSRLQLRSLGGRYDYSTKYTQYAVPVRGLQQSSAKKTRLDMLSSPPDDDFTFPTDPSREEMNGREMKLAYVRMFRYWHTPLHAAARLNNKEAAQALLDNGAEVDATAVGACGCSQKTLLPRAWTRSNAISKAHLAVATPLHVAICSGSYETAKLLVAHGASRLRKVLRSDAYPHWTDENPLHASLYRYHYRHFNHDFIEFVLNHGYAARIEERNHEDTTPLMLACIAKVKGDQEQDIIRLLVRYGANPNVICSGPPRGHEFYAGLHMDRYENDRATPLIWATRLGNYRAASVLLDLGAIAMRVSPSLQSSALHALCSPPPGVPSYVFARKHHIDLLDALLAQATVEDVNKFDAAGNTPLMHLINWKFSGEVKVITGNIESRLFEKGADILAGLEEGRTTPLEHAIVKSIQCYDKITYRHSNQPHPLLGEKMLALLQAFKVDQPHRRPKAFLNQFWGHLDSIANSPQITYCNVPSVLQAVIKAGFSPAETDQNGDNAMTSFLQRLLTMPKWPKYSRYGSTESELIPSIIAVLQENGVKLRARNKKGFNAFDYLQQITEYDGSVEERISLALAIKALVKPGQDEHGNWVVKYRSEDILWWAEFMRRAPLASLLREQTLEALRDAQESRSVVNRESSKGRGKLE
ncbi:hypothetical protein Daus18300_004587 [Diaporthe australafricana]|uniref:Ankyrin repeat protein n=1 Tax=Diaporthe australafricana TaxID=127596 RepID=A0ABR3X8F9_9PEZI